jgi:CBS domain-containing protein
MTTPSYAPSCIDPTATLSDAVKAAALRAGHGVPVITDEAKFAQAQAERARLSAQNPVTSGPTQP